MFAKQTSHPGEACASPARRRPILPFKFEFRTSEGVRQLNYGATSGKDYMEQNIPGCLLVTCLRPLFVVGTFYFWVFPGKIKMSPVTKKMSPWRYKIPAPDPGYPVCCSLMPWVTEAAGIRRWIDEDYLRFRGEGVNENAVPTAGQDASHHYITVYDDEGGSDDQREGEVLRESGVGRDRSGDSQGCGTPFASWCTSQACDRLHEPFVPRLHRREARELFDNEESVQLGAVHMQGGCGPVGSRKQACVWTVPYQLF